MHPRERLRHAVRGGELSGPDQAGLSKQDGGDGFWRSPQLIAAAALLVLIVTFVADISLSASLVVLTVFLAFSPLIASAALSPLVVGAFAAAATGLAVLSRLWDPGGVQYLARVVDVLLVGAIAVFASTYRVRRERDLATSQRIATVAQQALLPVLPDRIGQFRFATRYHSATASAQVGGDFFDFVADGNRIRLILGDVSGKGVDAVTQSARVIRAFRQYGASEFDLLSVARRIDAYVQPFWNWEFYATAVLVEIIDTARDVTVVSCGHPAPLHVSAAGAVTDLAVVPGVPLGLGPADEATRHPFGSSDRLLLFTDGLIEARDRQGVFLPRPSIEAALHQPTLEASLDALEATVNTHAGRFADDLALLLMVRDATGTAPPAVRSAFVHLAGVDGHDGAGDVASVV